MRLKGAVQKAFGRLGYTLMPSWRLQDHAKVSAMRSIFNRYRIDTVLDVGANEGQFVSFLRVHLGFTGRVFSFEPLPALAERCRQSAARDGNWEVFPFALGEAPGTLPLNEMARSSFSSFLAPRHDKVPEMTPANTIARQHMAEVKRLDDALPHGIDLSRTYLKLDTQGFDIAAAKGGLGVLTKIPALQTEVSFVPI